MIKVSTILAMMALLLTCGAGTASAASCAGTSSAISQLVSATPGGLDTLNAITFGTAVPTLVPRSEPNRDLLTYDTSRADFLIKGMAVSAKKAGQTKTSLLFIRLLKEGTPKEKLVFMSTTDKPYSFPSRFTLAVATGGVCRKVAEVFCALSCINTGTANEQCREDCRTIIVESCD